MRQMGVGIALPGRPPHFSIGVGEQGGEAPLRQRDRLLRPGRVRRVEGEIRVGEDPVGGRGRTEWVEHRSQEGLDLRGSQVGLAALQPIDVVLVDLEAGLVTEPAAQRLKADGHDLRVGERGRAGRSSRQTAGPIDPCRRVLIRGVGGVAHLSVDDHLAQRAERILPGFEPVRQHTRAVAQVPREARQFGQNIDTALKRRLPCGQGGKHAEFIPGVFPRDLASGSQGELFHQRLRGRRSRD